MNVQCPECSTVYRIDPARVPYEGVAARCRECGMVFRVEAGVSHAPGEVATAPAVAEPDPGASAGPEDAQPAEESTVDASAPQELAPDDGAPVAGEPAAASDEPARSPGGAAAPVFGPQDPRTRAGRLARALVSDIKVYNPEKWERSRADGTLRKEFRDEILKSWEEYVEQVGNEMAKKTPFFRDALNDILAGGDRVF